VFSELSKPPGHLPTWYPIDKGDMRSILYRGFRYIRNGDASEELYDLEGDPAERRNLVAAAAYADIVGGSRALVGQIR
jgi:hypothetical protein